MRKRDYWIAIIFVIFIVCLPTVTLIRGVLPQKEEISENDAQSVLNQNGTGAEDKTTASQETVEEKLTGFAAVQRDINNFINRLFLHTKFIAFNTELTRLMTGGQYIESTQVLAGKDNYLFYKTTIDGFPIYDYMGINHFTEEELAQIHANLTGMRDAFEQMGIDFYVVGLPNKESVYEQYMPDTISRVNTVTRADQVAEYLWNNSDVTFIYPKQELIDTGKEKQLYYKTDTHWNQIGAFIGFQQFYEAAFGVREQLTDVSFDEPMDNFAGDLATIAGVSDKYSIDTVYQLDATTVNPDMMRDETVFVVGDSFGGFFTTMAKAYFSEVEWIDPNAFTMSMVEEKHPDIIIFECVERYMERLKDVNLLAR